MTSKVPEGALGDCWLLAAIACLAEHDGAIQAVFRWRMGRDFMGFSGGFVGKPHMNNGKIDGFRLRLDFLDWFCWETSTGLSPI
jgi:hypothetical protein